MNQGSFLNLNKYIFKKIEIKSNIQNKNPLNPQQKNPQLVTQQIYTQPHNLRDFSLLNKNHPNSHLESLTNRVSGVNKENTNPRTLSNMLSSHRDKDEKISQLEKENLRLKRKLKEKDSLIKVKELEVKILKLEIGKLKRVESKKSNNSINNVNNVNSVNIVPISNAVSPNNQTENSSNPRPRMSIEPQVNPHVNPPVESVIPFEITIENSVSTVPQDINPDEMTYEQLLALQERIGFVSKGFTEDQIKKIPSFKYSKRNNHNIQKDDVLCTVCQEEFRENDHLRQFPCLHSFHVDCVDGWLKKEKVCPNCKEEIIIFD